MIQLMLFDFFADDERFIIESVICEYDIMRAMSKPNGEQVEYLRRRIVSARHGGGGPGRPSFRTYGVHILLGDSFRPNTNIRMYRIIRMARLAIEDAERNAHG